MNQDHTPSKLPDVISLLKEQQEQFHKSLSELLEDASPWAKAASPELILELRRLTHAMESVLDQVKRTEDELERMLEIGSEQFVKNYAVKPGSKA